MKNHQPNILKASLIAGVFFGIITITSAQAEELNDQLSDSTTPCSISSLKIEKQNLTPLSNALECLYDAYLELGYEKNSSRKLIRLDSQLQQLVEEVHKIQPKDIWTAAWDDKYKSLGLFASSELGYTGKLGKEAQGISDGRSDAAYTENPEAISKIQRDVIAQFKAQLAPFIAEYKEIERISNADPAKVERLFILDDKVRRFANGAGRFCGIFEQYDFKEIGIHTSEGKTWYWGTLLIEAEQLASSVHPKQPIRIIQSYGATTKNLALRNQLAQIYNEYIATNNNPAAAERLVELNRRLYNVIKEIIAYAPIDQSRAFWKDEYHQIGISIGHYSDQLEYDGKLILDAHRVNPNSRLREDTFFAYVFRNVSIYGGQPEISELAAYLKEFPSNKYTLTIYDNYANFYHGLYKYLKYGPKGRYVPEAKDECYKKYVTNQTIQVQASQAQQNSIAYLEKLILQSQGNERRRHEDKLVFVKSGNYEEEDVWCDVMD
ncbi:MAG: hypothetical protein WAW02_02845 [Sideroxyarcus sp.]